MEILGVLDIQGTPISEIFERVSHSGETVLITKKGIPFVKIDPCKYGGMDYGSLGNREKR